MPSSNSGTLCLLDLPSDIHQSIFDHLVYPDLLRTQRVCKALQDAISDARLKASVQQLEIDFRDNPRQIIGYTTSALQLKRLGYTRQDIVLLGNYCLCRGCYQLLSNDRFLAENGCKDSYIRYRRVGTLDRGWSTSIGLQSESELKFMDNVALTPRSTRPDLPGLTKLVPTASQCAANVSPVQRSTLTLGAFPPDGGDSSAVSLLNASTAASTNTILGLDLPLRDKRYPASVTSAGPRRMQCGSVLEM